MGWSWTIFFVGVFKILENFPTVNLYRINDLKKVWFCVNEIEAGAFYENVNFDSLQQSYVNAMEIA